MKRIKTDLALYYYTSYRMTTSEKSQDRLLLVDIELSFFVRYNFVRHPFYKFYQFMAGLQKSTVGRSRVNRS